jgi:hypothetical protein
MSPTIPVLVTTLSGDVDAPAAPAAPAAAASTIANTHPTTASSF